MPHVRTVIALIVLILQVMSSCTSKMRPVDYVDPTIDSHKSRWIYFSSACRPFGMVNLSPDTWVKGTWNSGYMYDSLHVRCFSHIHAWQMSGIPVMPTRGEFRGHLGLEANKSAFSHEKEIVKAGYHQVYLEDYDINAELTSTTRVGFHRYTFPEGEDNYLLFDLTAFLAHGGVTTASARRINDTEIEGYSLMTRVHRRPKDTYVYFVARLDRSFQFGGWDHGKMIRDEFIQGDSIGTYMQFSTKSGDPVLLKVGISYTSIENARLNLDREIPHWDFDRVKEESIKEWNHWLSRIEVEGGTERQRVKFYTDLWHALLGRRIVSDVDGSWCDMTGEDPVILQVELNEKGEPLFPHHNFDAWWGTHWSLNILWPLAYPEVTDAFCNTMVDVYEHGGLIPRGPSGGNYTFVMIGDPATPFFASAWNKGIRNYNMEKAYEGLVKNAALGGLRDHAGYEHETPATGGGMKYYLEQGYIPEGYEGGGWHKGGAGITMEYAYQDWCIAQLAKALGRNEDYKKYMERSRNYRNLWDESVGFIRPRNLDGSWFEDFQPVGEKSSMPGFVESNSAIYTNFVPHDMPGLMELFGGQEAYLEFLSSSFEKASSNNFIAEHGWHGFSWVDYENQPGTQMAHLFNLAGAPWLSQKWVREVKERTFGGITPYEGYNGDEDQGQMGALGVLMAMGLFQVDGGASVDPRYEITSPIFDKITIHLDPRYYPGKKFEIVTRNNGPDNVYIQSARLNGQILNNYWFLHQDLIRGGRLELELGPEPNKEWGIAGVKRD